VQLQRPSKQLYRLFRSIHAVGVEVPEIPERERFASHIVYARTDSQALLVGILRTLSVAGCLAKETDLVPRLRKTGRLTQSRKDRKSVVVGRPCLAELSLLGSHVRYMGLPDCDLAQVATLTRTAIALP
jgi:hypothetical protein